MHPSEASNYYNTQKSDGEFHGIIVDSYDVGAATFLMDKK